MTAPQFRLPHIRAAIVDENGRMTREFHDFLRNLATGILNVGEDIESDLTSTIGGDAEEAIQKSAQAIAAAEWPVGVILPFAGPELFLPLKFLWMDGGTHSHDLYPSLGFIYGSNPGGTFTLEDLRGIPIWGADDLNNPRQIVGDDDRDLAHTHGSGTLQTGAPSDATGVTADGTPVASDSHTHPISGDTGPSLGVTDIRPRRATYNWIIRAVR